VKEEEICQCIIGLNPKGKEEDFHFEEYGKNKKMA